MTQKLTDGQKSLLRLVIQGAGMDGWAPVSARVYPLLDKQMPRELIELESLEDGRGRARLTDAGQHLIDAMAWL